MEIDSPLFMLLINGATDTKSHHSLPPANHLHHHTFSRCKLKMPQVSGGLLEVWIHKLARVGPAGGVSRREVLVPAIIPSYQSLPPHSLPNFGQMYLHMLTSPTWTAGPTR